MGFTVGILGLGIIGGSLAKAFAKYTDNYIIGFEINEQVASKAISEGTVDKIGDMGELFRCDFIILAIYPKDCIEFVKNNYKYISKGTIVTDTCGVKKDICRELGEFSREKGFVFLGGHPMAGRESRGYDYSDADLFKSANYIFTPCNNSQEEIKKTESLLSPLGFSRFVYTTAQYHDWMIALTSQLPHIIACAYVMGEDALKHEGYSAGSFDDISRVANINEDLWSELFISNRTDICQRIEELVTNLNLFKDLINNSDKERLAEALIKAREIRLEL